MIPQEKLMPSKTYNIIHYSNDLLSDFYKKKNCLLLSFKLFLPFKLVLNRNMTEC